jgi:hypothetical protein
VGYQNQAWLDQWREPVIDPDQLSVTRITTFGIM